MNLRDFDIDLNRHREDHFQLDFTLEDAFFALKENSLFNHCMVSVLVNCDRVENTLTLKYSLSGQVGCQCERCLDPIHLALNSSYTEAVQITGDPQLLEEEFYISENNPVYSVYDSLYEHICMNVPSRLICENAIEQKECEIPSNEDNNDDIDPRWDKLKSLIK